MKIIPYNEDYEFCFLEQNPEKITHPVSDYFLKIDDLSINLLCSIKWIEWGYHFFKTLSNEIKDVENFDLELWINKPLQSIKNLKIIEEKHVLLINNVKVNSKAELKNLIKETYGDKILNSLSNENIKVHIKLKLNIREYLLISSVQFPTLIKWDRVKIFE